MYLPNPSDLANWDASPHLAPPELLAQSPKSWIAVAELDILCEEGKRYGGQLEALGVATEVQIIPGSTHSILVLDGALRLGRKLVLDAAEALAEAFGSTLGKEDRWPELDRHV